MSKKKLTVAQELLLDTLMGLDPTTRAEELGKLGLTCDMTQANLLYTERLDLMAQITKLQDEHAARMVAERAALEPCVREYTPALDVGWYDRRFVDNVETSYAQRSANVRDLTIEGILTKCNRGEPLTTDEASILQNLTGTCKTTAQNSRRLSNLLYVNQSGEIAGRSYTFSKAEARRFCEWACGYWRGEHKNRQRRWTHYSEEHTAEITMTHAAIGCQTLAREEVTRIAALFGWADVPKQVGPEVPGKEAAKPKTPRLAKSPVRTRRRTAVAVEA
jgi:hypothetical protein